VRALLASLVLLSAGCTCGTVEEPPSSAFGTVGTSGGPPQKKDAGVDEGFLFVDGGVLRADGGLCALTCSDDLQVLTDCDGRSISCPMGTGCSPRGCIDPCLAAIGSQSTTGCEFFSVAVPREVSTINSCYAVFVANTWNTPVELTVNQGSTILDVSSIARIPVSLSDGVIDYRPLPSSRGHTTLPVGEMAILFLGAAGDRGLRGPASVDCPIDAGVQSGFQLAGVGRLEAFHITSSAPVIAYDIYPYGGAKSFVASASLLLPTSAWSTSHVGVTPSNNAGLQFYAQEDDTHVRIDPTVDVVGTSDVAGTTAHVPVTWTLHRGEVVQLNQSAELGGSLIRSDKPIGVMGSAGCINKPLNVCCCDSAHQQLPGVSLLGNEYFGVRYPSRGGTQNERSKWRVVGIVDGTQLSYEPAVSGAPTRLAAGEVVEFDAEGPFLVSSQDVNHMFYAAQFMTSADPFDGDGDPDFVNLVPSGQYLKKYLFFTDPTYERTSLVFIRTPGADGRFHDVSLDCANTGSWTRIGNTRAEFAIVSWSRSAPNGCINGVHTATSDGPFALTVWGTDFYSSYGYPAGTGVRALNAVSVGPDFP
jgi:IgGFc binding protein